MYARAGYQSCSRDIFIVWKVYYCRNFDSVFVPSQAKFLFYNCPLTGTLVDNKERCGRVVSRSWAKKLKVADNEGRALRSEVLKASDTVASFGEVRLAASQQHVLFRDFQRLPKVFPLLLRTAGKSLGFNPKTPSGQSKARREDQGERGTDRHDPIRHLDRIGWRWIIGTTAGYGFVGCGAWVFTGGKYRWLGGALAVVGALLGVGCGLWPLWYLSGH